MITGSVNTDYEAIIRLRVQGPLGHEHEVDAIIDTGFNGFLTLPPLLVSELGLARLSRGRALLANGSEELFDIHGVTVVWDGELPLVEVDLLIHAPRVVRDLEDWVALRRKVVEPLVV